VSASLFVVHIVDVYFVIWSGFWCKFPFPRFGCLCDAFRQKCATNRVLISVLNFVLCYVSFPLRILNSHRAAIKYVPAKEQTVFEQNLSGGECLVLCSLCLCLF
jgi:hypothetical protein